MAHAISVGHSETPRQLQEIMQLTWKLGEYPDEEPVRTTAGT